MLIISYSPWLNRSPFLGLIAPGLGFGISMVLGTHMLLTSPLEPSTWLVALTPFCLNNNLLLLNQYPNINADKSVDRRTFSIVYGTHKSSLTYAFFMLLANSLIVALIIEDMLPKLSSIALAPILLSLYALMGAWKHGSKTGQHPEYPGAKSLQRLQPLCYWVFPSFLLNLAPQHPQAPDPKCNKSLLHRKITSTSITMALYISDLNSHGKLTTRSTTKVRLSRQQES